VDNGSTDGTREVIASFKDRLPLTYVFEPVAGKNTALNAGLQAVQGDLVVFSDDDAFPRPDWLVKLRAAADSQPSFGMFGGIILPRWETRPPKWLLNCVPTAPTYTLSDPNLVEGAVDAGSLFGPNFAIRTAIFRRGYRFDTSIGPTNSRWYAMGSETEMVLRLQNRGVKAYWVPSAVVEHFIRSAQLDPVWLLGRAVRAGRGNFRMEALLDTEPEHRTAPSVARCFQRAARWFAQAVVSLFSFNRTSMMRAWWSLSFVTGYTVEALRWQAAQTGSIGHAYEHVASLGGASAERRHIASVEASSR
jgi:hypothetical protein